LIDISILGDKKLQKKLNKLIDKDAKKIVVQSVRTGANIVKERAQSLAPQGKTGRLKSGLRLRTSTRRNRLAVFIQTKKRSHFNIAANSKFFYPAIVEFGAPRSNIPANSYLRRAMEERRERALTVIRRNIKVKLLRGFRK
jgi:HK97 gp10 family phage protein